MEGTCVRSCFTARDVIRCFKRVLPEYSEADLWEISNQLMMQINQSYGSMTPDAAATQSMALAAEDLAEALERVKGPRALAKSKALWYLAGEARSSPEMFAVHRKGFGVVCAKSQAGGLTLLHLALIHSNLSSAQP